MRFVKQTLKSVIQNLRDIEVDWRDSVADRVIQAIERIPVKAKYDEEDIIGLFDSNFEGGKIITRLFLGLSKDAFVSSLSNILGDGGQGINRFKKDRSIYIKALVELGVLSAMAKEINRIPKWSDVLVERLRSGRGSAISGQRRGRGMEDFVEIIVKRIFRSSYDLRCKFVGKRGLSAKCDLAIPNKDNPRIIIESKGYGATGSKMSDVIGDIDAIISAKRPDTTFLIFTDGLSWKQRQSDLRKLIERQNNGEIARIYTRQMSKQFVSDLNKMKSEYGI